MLALQMPPLQSRGPSASPLRSLPSRLNRPYVWLLGVVLLNLALSALWISSIQREQHIDDMTSPSNSADLMLRFSAMSEPKQTCVCPANGDCNRQVTQAIAQLEQLKSQMHAGAVSPAVAPRKAFLLIAIPSFPRTGGADYLSTVLAALDRQLVHNPFDPMYGQIVVWVMNNAPSNMANPVFETNRQRYEGRAEFRFLVNDHSLPNPLPGVNDLGSADVPGARVRKQTRDVVRLMQMAKGASHYYLAMEDDFEVCPNGLRMIEHMLRKAAALAPSRAPGHDWVSMKLGYGFNGYMMRNNRDLEVFAAYLLTHQRRRPPDHLNTEWSCSEKPESRAYVQGRPHLTYRYNLFDHLGKMSSLRAMQSVNFPRCLHEMNPGVVFEIDAFDFKRCEHDDLSPCLPKEHEAWMPPYGVDLKQVEIENKKKKKKCETTDAAGSKRNNGTTTQRLGERGKGQQTAIPARKID